MILDAILVSNLIEISYDIGMGRIMHEARESVAHPKLTGTESLRGLNLTSTLSRKHYLEYIDVIGQYMYLAWESGGLESIDPKLAQSSSLEPALPKEIDENHESISRILNQIPNPMEEWRIHKWPNIKTSKSFHKESPNEPLY